MLITVGTLIGLSVSVLFVYILPLLYGIYLAPCSAIGVAIANLFFAAAALLGNAFRINADVASGLRVPTLNRVVVIVVVAIYRFVDQTEFVKKSEFWREANFTKENFAMNLLYSDHKLRMNTEMDLSSRAKFLVDEYQSFIK
ncbi:hypothetical protein EHR03_12935 [Leptospira mayottensis]|uniref:Uncharacterized protein n=1 Tax=Leptospira mayottensis 200901116 TaxID=1192864 RepID=A0A343US34_9LEPT|nr:hypothetical protein [Leptospira mayottensis]AVH81607.1 hypothetical protein [Leptospira mayottensis 200901116]TGN00330.1 hypothetical protein EHR03_12935 [Leptospira mayottensis]